MRTAVGVLKGDIVVFTFVVTFLIYIFVLRFFPLLYHAWIFLEQFLIKPSMKLRNKKIIPHRPSRGLPRGAVRCGEDSKSTIRLFIPQASTDISATVHQGLPVFCEETKSSRRLITLRASTVQKITVNHKPRCHSSDNILRDVKLRDKVIDSCDTFSERNTNCQMCCIMSDAQEFFTSSVSS